MPGILTKLDCLPPYVCRVIARVPGKKRVALSNIEIAKRSGLTVAKVLAVARLRTWETVPVGIVDKFRYGCGITPENQRRHVEYLKSTLGKCKRKVIHGLAHLE